MIENSQWNAQMTYFLKFRVILKIQIVDEIHCISESKDYLNLYCCKELTLCYDINFIILKSLTFVLIYCLNEYNIKRCPT